jgi:hypothetical protein
MDTKPIATALAMSSSDAAVPHISLVFREMWDSTPLRLVSVQAVKGRPTRTLPS